MAKLNSKKLKKVWKDRVLLNRIIFQEQCFFIESNLKKLTEENVCFKAGKCLKSMQITLKKVSQFFINFILLNTIKGLGQQKQN